MIEEARDFAAWAHHGQVRKYTGEPYMVHPEEVAAILVEQVPNVPDEVVAAALLHDTMEDTHVTFKDLTTLFGDEVALLVLDVTTPRHKGRRPARIQKEARRLAGIDPDAQNIKYADIISNTRDIVQTDLAFASVYLWEKRLFLLRMEDGYGPLRHSAWLQIIGDLHARR